MGGCFHLGGMYEKGEGIEQDTGKAAALYRQTCEGGNMGGCYSLGWMYEKGEGVEKDTDEAAALFRQACEGGSALACFSRESRSPRTGQ